jgi:ABC-type antimicrobial peptide transport system permease subunit
VLRQFSWPVALYGVSNLDPASYATAIGVLIAIVFAASVLPARRALRLDLAKTLHYD